MSFYCSYRIWSIYSCLWTWTECMHIDRCIVLFLFIRSSLLILLSVSSVFTYNHYLFLCLDQDSNISSFISLVILYILMFNVWKTQQLEVATGHSNAFASAGSHLMISCFPVLGCHFMFLTTLGILWGLGERTFFPRGFGFNSQCLRHYQSRIN